MSISLMLKNGAFPMFSYEFFICIEAIIMRRGNAADA